MSRADSDEISARPDSAQPAWASLGSWTSAGHKILLCKVLLTFHFIRFHFIRFHLIRFHLIRFNFMKIFFVNSFYSNITTTRDRRNICTSDLKDMREMCCLLVLSLIWVQELDRAQAIELLMRALAGHSFLPETVCVYVCVWCVCVCVYVCVCMCVCVCVCVCKSWIVNRKA